MVAFLCFSHSAEYFCDINCKRARRMKHLPTSKQQQHKQQESKQSKRREEESFQDVPKRGSFFMDDEETTTTKSKKQLSYIQQHAMVIIFLTICSSKISLQQSEFHHFFLCHMHDDFKISGKEIYQQKCSIQQ